MPAFAANLTMLFTEAPFIEYALVLEVRQLNCLAGKRAPGHGDRQHQDTLSENLKFAADELGANGIRLLIEPINHFDIPGFFLNRTDQALAILQQVERPNLFIQYDVYHAQREEGELTATIRKNIGRIGHIQVADNPGRHQPGTGEINYPFLFQELDRLGDADHAAMIRHYEKLAKTEVKR